MMHVNKQNSLEGHLKTIRGGGFWGFFVFVFIDSGV
jgi:hypothetical protein